MHSLDGDDPIDDKKYKGKTKAGEATPRFNADGSVNSDAYNCHSFAYCDSLGDPYDPANSQSMADGYPLWDSDPYNNIVDCYSPLDFNAPNIVGDRVTYFKYDPNTKTVAATHSGIVTRIDANGRAVEITNVSSI